MRRGWVLTPLGSFRVPSPTSESLAQFTSPGSTVHVCVRVLLEPDRHGGLGRRTRRCVLMGWAGARCLCPGPVVVVGNSLTQLGPCSWTCPLLPDPVLRAQGEPL